MIFLRNSPLELGSLQAVLFWEIKVSAPRRFLLFKMTRKPSRSPEGALDLPRSFVKSKHVTKANPRVLSPGAPQRPRRGPWVPPSGPEGPLGPEALRAGGLGKHGLAITRSALDRHGLSKSCGLAVFGEAGLGLKINIFSQNPSTTSCNLPRALWNRYRAPWSRPKAFRRRPSPRARGVWPASKLVPGEKFSKYIIQKRLFRRDKDEQS